MARAAGNTHPIGFVLVFVFGACLALLAFSYNNLIISVIATVTAVIDLNAINLNQFLWVCEFICFFISNWLAVYGI
jgi:hypothetical protein